MNFSFTGTTLLEKNCHLFIPDTRQDARAFQKGLPSRRLRHLLPLQEGLSGEIFISVRSMPKQLRQCLKVSVLRNEAAFEISLDRKSTRLNSSHLGISYAVFCLKK